MQSDGEGSNQTVESSSSQDSLQGVPTQNPHTFFFKTVIFISSAYLCFICRQHPHPRSPIPEVRYACLEMALLFHVDISCTSVALFFGGGVVVN